MPGRAIKYLGRRVRRTQTTYIYQTISLTMRALIPRKHLQSDNILIHPVAYI